MFNLFDSNKKLTDEQKKEKIRENNLDLDQWQIDEIVEGNYDEGNFEEEELEEDDYYFDDEDDGEY